MYQRRRNLVTRADGTVVNVARPRGQLFVCATGCCCGRTEDGFAPVSTDLYHQEWERRRLRNVVHLTIGGCLGPCALANVVLLLFDGQALWFHSVNSGATVLALYDYVDAMLDADGVLPAPRDLAALQFTASTWQQRPDGAPVDDFRPRRHETSSAVHAEDDVCKDDVEEGRGSAADLPSVRGYGGHIGAPMKNGQLVFDEPWQGRAFGMAIALHEQGLFEWEEFRRELIARVAAAEASEGAFEYYEVWLETFERLLERKGVVRSAEVEEATFQFEFGERDDVF